MESPFHVHLRRIIDRSGETLYTTMEASRMVGRSDKTLRRWRKAGWCRAPSKEVVVNGQTIYLFTERDIDELTVLASEMYPGRRTDRE